MSSVDSTTPQSPDEAGRLPVGGEGANVTYVTFWVEGVNGRQLTGATLYLTGIEGGGNVSVAVAPGVAIDEWGLTASAAPGGTGVGSAWVGSGSVAAIDVTGWITADGPVTFIISGGPAVIGSREAGLPATLDLTILGP